MQFCSYPWGVRFPSPQRRGLQGAELLTFSNQRGLNIIEIQLPISGKIAIGALQ
ncbi:MAG TPA: hypothetical protein PK844_03100 [Candidatus Atribacteria bacterium]|nr:hypothetical protein [Candidatus Atribacteria bacterium]HQE24632.1 hypothetical protein [Candidatus Atribacteria bacterium]